MDPVILIVIVVAVALGGAGISALLIQAGIRKLRNQFSSSLIGQIYSGINRELAESNRSITDIDFLPRAEPKSVSDLSSALVPSIAKDFPEMNISQMESSVEQLLTMTLAEIGRRTGGPPNHERPLFADGFADKALPIQVTSAYRESINRRINDLKLNNQIESFTGIKIHRTGIRSYEKTEGTRTITFETAIEYFHVIKQNGKVVSGNPDQPEQSRYSIRIVYIIDESKLSGSDVNAIGMICPNCGAAVRILENRHCLYCGVGLTPVDIRIWRADELAEK